MLPAGQDREGQLRPAAAAAPAHGLVRSPGQRGEVRDEAPAQLRHLRAEPRQLAVPHVQGGGRLRVQVPRGAAQQGCAVPEHAVEVREQCRRPGCQLDEEAVEQRPALRGVTPDEREVLRGEDHGPQEPRAPRRATRASLRSPPSCSDRRGPPTGPGARSDPRYGGRRRAVHGPDRAGRGRRSRRTGTNARCSPSREPPARSTCPPRCPPAARRVLPPAGDPATRDSGCPPGPPG